MDWSANDKCPLDVCCSKCVPMNTWNHIMLIHTRFGFCGTTEPFCGDKEVDRPSCSSSKGLTKSSVTMNRGVWRRGLATAFCPKRSLMGFTRTLSESVQHETSSSITHWRNGKVSLSQRSIPILSRLKPPVRMLKTWCSASERWKFSNLILRFGLPSVAGRSVTPINL